MSEAPTHRPTSSVVEHPDGPSADGWITLHDAHGTPHQVPLRPDGAYIKRLQQGAARRDAARPLEQLLDELSAATGALDELERAFAHRRR